MFSTNSPRSKKGFTLLELIVVVVVLGILAAIAIPSFSTVKQSAADKVAVQSAESVVRNAKALAAFDGAALSDVYVDQAGEEIGVKYNSSTNTVTVTSGGETGAASINATTGVVTVVGSTGSTGGNGNSVGGTYGAATTVEAGTFNGITISMVGPAQLVNDYYPLRVLPIDFTLDSGYTIRHYNADWTETSGYRLQPVIFDASGVELTDTAYKFRTGELQSSGFAARPGAGAISQSSGAPFYALFVDYTNPNQAEFYQTSTDVFAGATIAFRVTDPNNGSQVIGYTNRIAVNWG